MQSLLITGGNVDIRKKYILAELLRLKISKFDRFYVKADDSVKIEQIRNLVKQLSRKPIQGKGKAGIILAAEKATIEAQNALLKLLEEPPKTAFLFLSAPNPKHLVATIASRCKIVRVHHDAPVLDKQTEEEMKKIFGRSKGGAFYIVKGSTLNIAFELAEQYGRTRESADQFLQDALLYIRQEYLDKGGAFYNVKGSTLNIARKLLLSRRLISANVNPRQVLENLFLDL